MIVVDDRIPLDRDMKPLVLSCPHSIDIWPILLSKALLKIAALSRKDDTANEFGDFDILSALRGTISEKIMVCPSLPKLLKQLNIPRSCEVSQDRTPQLTASPQPCDPGAYTNKKMPRGLMANEISRELEVRTKKITRQASEIGKSNDMLLEASITFNTSDKSIGEGMLIIQSIFATKRYGVPFFLT